MDKFNQLSSAQEERLVYLIEECSEVIKASTKILRHGYYSYDPTNKDHLGNKVDLETEIQDVLNAITHLYNKGDIDWQFEFPSKFFTLKYMHHQ